MRTKNSIKNVLSNVILNLTIGILGFIKVKVFVNGLSEDIYSLNQLFYQIFSYIAITDLGVGLIINKNLYDAFAKDDKEKINKIYSTSKKFYGFIGLFMIAMSIILCFFIKYLTKASVSITYLKLIFLIFMVRNIIDYFYVSPRFVLEANQKMYKLNHFIRGIKILEVVIEIILVLLKVNYIFILIPGIIITIVINIFVNNKIFKEYPWLKDEKIFDVSYIRGTKDIIWQLIASLLNSNTDIILISTFINPVAVIIYTSYTYITKFIKDTINIVSSAITPSFANLIIKDNDKSYEIFDELDIGFEFIASFVYIMLFCFLTSLIKFWIGEQYTVNMFTLFLFCMSLYQLISERAVIMTINAKGLFKEIKVATIMEAIINLSISLFLVNKVGISGVLLGTVISKFVTLIYNPICIKKHIGMNNVYNYYFKYILCLIYTCIITLIFSSIRLNIKTVIAWILFVVGYAILVFIVLFILYYCTFKSFRNILLRVKCFIEGIKK